VIDIDTQEMNDVVDVKEDVKEDMVDEELPEILDEEEEALLEATTSVVTVTPLKRKQVMERTDSQPMAKVTFILACDICLYDSCYRSLHELYVLI